MKNLPPKQNKLYTGVGSRETPVEICELFTKIAEQLESFGYTLRSGGAKGADMAFEQGVTNLKEIYTIDLKNPPCHEAFKIAYKIRGSFIGLNMFGRLAHARNVYQVLGEDLQTPSDFLVCWTKNGTPRGGTRTAILLAKESNIPVYNFGNTKDIMLFFKFLEGIRCKE